MVDPWLSGTAFNEGWALLAEAPMGPEDWRGVTHLWHSHEHPDHFSPRTLREIPEAVRAGITLLYQVTEDRKVATFCRELGFREVIELAPAGWHALAPGFEVRCEPWRNGDSWLAVRTPEATLVNLNDCAIRRPDQVARVRAAVGRVDVLTTQFSISAWDGNPEDGARLRRGAQRMLERLRVQVQGLEARWTLPFASYVWFCHEENAFLNAYHNRVHDAVELLREQTSTRPLVLYPGEGWEIGSDHDPALALDRWAAEYASVPSRPLIRAGHVSEAELVSLSRTWCARVRAGSDPLRLRLRLARQTARSRRARAGRGIVGAIAGALSLALLSVPEAWIWVSDLEAAFCLGLAGGLRRSSRARGDCDVELSSDSLRFAFQFLFGGETLQVNARFRELRENSRLPLFHYFALAGSRNRGERLGWRQLLARVLGR